MATPNRKNALARLGTPTPGAGKIPRTHRYEHENLADEVVVLQDQVAQLLATVGSPGGGGTPGTGLFSLIGGSGGDNQGPQSNTTSQGDGQGPLVGPQGPPGPPGPAGGGVDQRIIVLWDTSQGPVPPGWHVCDGTNGTPNIVGSASPLLELSTSSGAIAGTGFTFPVAGTTDNATLTSGCVQSGTGGSALTGPTTHDHTYSANVTFATDAVLPNLTRYKLLPIMWIG